MRVKAKLIEVGGGDDEVIGRLVTMEVETIDGLRELGPHLYEEVYIEDARVELPCYLCADPAKDDRCSTAICPACSERLRTEVRDLQQTVAMFASAIKSGEPWSPVLEEQLEKMRKA